MDVPVASVSASVASDGDAEKDDQEEDDEDRKMQQSMLGFSRKDNHSMSEEKKIDADAEAVAFGVRTDDASTMKCPLNDTNTGVVDLSTPTPMKHSISFTDIVDLSTPTPMKRSISFNDIVELNHVASFKHELSTKEKEQCWYTDVEQVIMKIDGGVYNTTAGDDRQNQQQKQKEEEEKAQQHRASTGTLTKAEEKRAEEMRKKYGIDQKKKKKRSKSTTIGRSKSVGRATIRSAKTEAASASTPFIATEKTRERRTQELRVSASAAEQKTKEKLAAELRKKYGIEKKLKLQEIRQSAASVTPLALTDATTKKKKKGFSSLFGKKKKKQNQKE